VHRLLHPKAATETLQSFRFPALILALFLPLAALAQDGIFADFDTSMGSFTCELEYRRCPQTVANFIALATGSRPWVDPGTGKVQAHPFYDGLLFHRVIDGFMIQTGSPNGEGTDGPGYAIQDEFDAELRHSGPGILSMANSGPNSNGSQFFVTVATTPWLDDSHTVFGRVTDGYAVVEAISRVSTQEQNRPVVPVRLDRLTIRRVGPAAAAFDVHTQGLPDVSQDRVTLARINQRLTLSFARPLHASLRLRESTNLVHWTSTLLGIELDPAGDERIEVQHDLSARFFTLTRVQYPSSTFAPRSLTNRTLDMTFDVVDATLSLVFDGQGGGTYTFEPEEPGTITGADWTQDPYRGHLSLSTSELFPMLLRLDFTSETAGRVSGTVLSLLPFHVTGVFTLSPQRD
jgi:peptidyl-prolyl cis-trans isomerase A (cyclophilin A)